MDDKTYNGWTNYETWLVKLWIDNEQGDQERWIEAAREAMAEPTKVSLGGRDLTAYHLGQLMKDEFTEATPELEGFWADLLNSALSEVNWQEIAGSFLDDVKDEEPTEAE